MTFRPFPWNPRARFAAASAPGVGACCESCAGGGGCEAHGAVGFLGAERARPFSEVEKLDGDVTHYAHDFEAWSQAQAHAHPFMLTWNQFQGEWMAWFAENVTDWRRSLVDGVVGTRLDQFEDFERRFRELLREGAELGVKSSVLAPPVGSPIEQWLTSIGPHAKWAIPLGLGVIAFVLLGPALLPTIGGFFAHKAAGAAVRAAAPRVAAAAL